MFWEAVKRLDRLIPNFGTHVNIHLGMVTRQRNCPSRHKWALGGFRGLNIQKSWEAVKRLDRLAPTLVHVCGFILEWIYSKQIAPRDTRGHLGVFRGSNIQKYWEAVKRLADWHQLWFTSADSSGNGHRLNTSRPSIPQGAFRGLLRFTNSKVLGAVKWLDRLAPTLVDVCGFIWEWIYSKQIAPRDTRGHLGVFRGSNIQKYWEAVKRLADWHQLWFTSADSSGNGHRLNTSRPSIPQGAFRGLLGVKNSGKLSNGWTDWHRILDTSADSSRNGHRLNTIRPSILQGISGGGGV